MKKILFFALVAAIAFTSCKKKSNDETETDPFKLQYSNLSTEQHKQKIEASGVEFVQKISSLPDEKFIDVLDFLQTLNPSVAGPSFSSVLAVNQAAKNKSLKGLFQATTSVEDNTAKLSELYGVYTWNASTETWDESVSTSKLEFKFPSSPEKTTNDATLTMTYTKSNVVVESEDDGESVELPASVSSTLRVGSKDEMKLISSYEYKTDGTPTKVDINFMLGSFSLITKVSNDVTNLTSEFSILKGTEVLLSLKTSANGNLAVDNAKDAEEFDAVVKNANATFEIMNIKLAGQVDVKAIRDAEKAASTLPEAERNKKGETAWNTHSKLVAINKTDNTVIAKVQYKSISDEYCYYSYNNAQVCETDYYLDPQLVFKDGSPMSIDEFFEGSFGSLIDDLDEFSADFD
ncbi:MAG TPA: hypothetical protein VF602_09975 [Pedobacter sp.]|jgi:hypothetical protein